MGVDVYCIAHKQQNNQYTSAHRKTHFFEWPTLDDSKYWLKTRESHQMSSKPRENQQKHENWRENQQNHVKVNKPGDPPLWTPEIL